MALPQMYRHAVFREQGAPLTIEKTELKLPAPGELLVKVQACGVCYSDVFAQHNILGGGFPITPGHEIIGSVAHIGEGLKGWQVGDRVGAGWHGGHDGTCTACKKGFYQMCDNQSVNGETRNGGYAEYCLIRAEAAVHVPSHLDAATYAPILCAGLTIFNSIRHMDVPAGATVAVHGLGGLGHLAVQYASKLGYNVVAISRGSDKEVFARGLGAHEYVDSSKVDPGEALREMGGAGLVVTTAPSGEVMPGLLAGLGVLGKLLILSVPGDVPFNTGVMLRRGLSIHSWPCGHATDAEETIQFTELQNIGCMVEKFPLERANDAFRAMQDGAVRFRGVITME